MLNTSLNVNQLTSKCKKERNYLLNYIMQKQKIEKDYFTNILFHDIWEF